MGTSTKSVLGLMVVVGLAVAVATVAGCEESIDARVFGVWRFVGVEGEEAQKAAVAADGDDVAATIFFEFTETSATMYAIVDDEVKSDTTAVKWESIGGKLYCKNPTGNGAAIVIVTDENTLCLVKDSQKKGLKLTRSSVAELDAAKTK